MARLCALLVALVSCTSALLPSWTAPKLDPAKFPFGGATPVPGRNFSRLFKGTPDIGTYNMSPMIDFYKGAFLATWKCAPRDEDQPGQLILFSQSQDGVHWTPSDGKNILFPNMSTNANKVALFAEPTVHINDRTYAAASPKQFCLYPDQYFSLLLLREVLPGVGQFGKIFWAAGAIPAGFEEASAINHVVTLRDMDAVTQADIAMLNNPTFPPCAGAAAGTPKCEFCLNGCQPWSDTKNVTGLENERSHYVVPGSSPQTDVILYRSRLHKEVKEGPNHLYASVRSSPSGAWTLPIPTNITDDVANFNAGVLPDGRIYLLSNAMINVFRDPLFITTSIDGWHFSQTHVAVSCEEAIFRDHDQPLGCLQRCVVGSPDVPYFPRSHHHHNI
jgi:hypothetical protein